MSANVTKREREILAQVATMKHYKTIAFELGVSFGTVRTHVYNLRKKLGANDRFELITIARRMGLVEPDPVQVTAGLVAKGATGLPPQWPDHVRKTVSKRVLDAAFPAQEHEQR